MDSFPQPQPDMEPAPAAVALLHPGWCDPGSCAAGSGGPHRSTPAIIIGDRIGSGRLRLRVWSPSDDPGDPIVLIELVAADCDSGHRLRVDLSMRQLGQLRRALAVVAGQVGGR